MTVTNPSPQSDHRLAAQSRILALVQALTSQPANPAFAQLIEECESLARAIGAFHMEGIRFRMFNVDRQLVRTDLHVPAEVPGIFAEARTELEAAGFHTRSHQAPT